MFFGIKGPKELLANAIAEALAMYFEVDKDHIESNLLRDTRIVLKGAQLKPQIKLVQKGENESTTVEVSGYVDEVKFSWKWAVAGKDKAWVSDAELLIQGPKFVAGFAKVPNDKLESVLTPENPSIEEKVDAPKEEKEKSGFQAYIQHQVAMVLESLRLQMKDYLFTIVLPPSDPTQGPPELAEGYAIIIGGQSIDIISLGKKGEDKLLRQVLEISAFAIDVLEPPMQQGKRTCRVKHPLMEPFSYRTSSKRLFGERFTTGMGVGLEVLGETNEESNVAFHAGKFQIDAIDQLMKLILAPAGVNHQEDAKSAELSPEEKEILEADKPTGEGTELQNTPSWFEFPLKSVSLVVMDSTKIFLPTMTLKYRADGTVALVEAERLDALPTSSDVESMKLGIQGIHASLRPDIELKLGVIEELRIPEVVELITPIEQPVIVYRQDVLNVEVSSYIEIIRLRARTGLMKRDEGESKQQEEADADANAEPKKSGFFESIATKASSLAGSRGKSKEAAHKLQKEMNVQGNSGYSVPVPITISLGKIGVKNETADLARTTFQDIEIAATPIPDGSHVALCLGQMKNEMIDLHNLAVSAVLPRDTKDVIKKLRVAAESIDVTAGYSVEDWFRRFNNHERNEKTKHEVTYKLPNASIEALRLRIALEGNLVSNSGTNIAIKPFVGDENTTQTDVTKYYVGAVLTQVPGFITHVELLGLNVVDSGATTFGTYALAATPVGPLGGLAAVTGVDAVKGVIAAGKRNRQSTDEDKAQFGDIFRGVVQAAKESASDGARRRGKEGKGDVVDWVVGATAHTSEYAKENKARLGGAGAGGVAMVFGTILAGPVGGIAAGIATSAVTEKVIDKADAAFTKHKGKEGEAKVEET